MLKGRPLVQRHPGRWLAAGVVLFVSGLALLTIAGNLGVGGPGEPITALPVPAVPPAETSGPTRPPATCASTGNADSGSSIAAGGGTGAGRGTTSGTRNDGKK